MYKKMDFSNWWLFHQAGESLHQQLKEEGWKEVWYIGLNSCW